MSAEVAIENEDNGDNGDDDDDVDDDINGRRKLPTLLTLQQVPVEPPPLRVIFAMMIPNLVVVQPIIAVYY